MLSIDVKNFTNDASEVAEPNNARVETVEVGGQTIRRLTLQPGWKWSQDIKPLVGTDSCQAHHVGICIEGSLTAIHDDGTEKSYGAGDAYVIAPGHDAWVTSDTAAVVFEFHAGWGE